MTTESCGEHYGHNPDPCYREAGHKGPHNNKWGTTWARGTDWTSRAYGAPIPTPTTDYEEPA